VYILWILGILAKRGILVYISSMSFTYKPNKRKRAKTHGFLARSKTSAGKKVIQGRRQKGRAKVAI
jgi:large subunit ribosomal protein L34